MNREAFHAVVCEALIKPEGLAALAHLFNSVLGKLDVFWDLTKSGDLRDQAEKLISEIPLNLWDLTERAVKEDLRFIKTGKEFTCLRRSFPPPIREAEKILKAIVTALSYPKLGDFLFPDLPRKLRDSPLRLQELGILKNFLDFGALELIAEEKEEFSKKDFSIQGDTLTFSPDTDSPKEE